MKLINEIAIRLVLLCCFESVNAGTELRSDASKINEVNLNVEAVDNLIEEHAVSKNQRVV